MPGGLHGAWNLDFIAVALRSRVARGADACLDPGGGLGIVRCRFHYSSSIDWILCCRLKILLATARQQSRRDEPGPLFTC